MICYQVGEKKRNTIPHSTLGLQKTSSISCYGKTRMNFLANAVHREFWKGTSKPLDSGGDTGWEEDFNVSRFTTFGFRNKKLYI